MEMRLAVAAHFLEQYAMALCFWRPFRKSRMSFFGFVNLEPQWMHSHIVQGNVPLQPNAFPLK
jgi:hypothetical protein